MIVRPFFAIAALSALSACVANPQSEFNGQRTVFDNPYSASIDRGPVGPDQCAECPGVEGRLLEVLNYPGRGRFAYDRNGNRVELSRSERRTLRQRFDAIEDQAEINRRVAAFNAAQAALPPPPVPSAPPVAVSIPPEDRSSAKNAQPNLGEPR